MHVLVLSGHGLAFQDNVTQQYYGRGVGNGGPDVIRRAKSLFVSSTIGTRALLMDQSDFLTVPELRFALREIAKSSAGGLIDVVVFDACLMSSIETLYEPRGLVGAAVGAVDEISGAGMNLAGAAGALSANGSPAGLSPVQIAQAFVSAYAPGTASDSCVAIALDEQSMAEGVRGFGQFAASLLPEIRADADLARRCRDALATSSRTMVRYKSKSLADFAAVYASLRAAGLSSTTQTSLDQAVHAFAELVIDSRLGADYANALGISLFAPSSQDQFRINADDYRKLNFAIQTKWIDVLDFLYNQLA